MLLRDGLGLGREEGGVGLSERFIELLAKSRYERERVREKGVKGVQGVKVHLKISSMRLGKV